MNAPTGSTAAAIGSGVTTDTTSPVGDIEIDSHSNNTINNNVNLAAQTGDASVNRNTSAGDATSGNATASANVLNIIGSDLSFSDWFGVLFINVFGSWMGSFGVDTPYGNPAAPAGSQAAQGGGSGVFSFSPGENTPTQVSRISYYVYGTPLTSADVNVTQENTQTTEDQNNPGAVLATADEGGPTSGIPAAVKGTAPWAVPLAGMLIGMIILGSNSAYDLVQQRRKAVA